MPKGSSKFGPGGFENPASTPGGLGKRLGNQTASPCIISNPFSSLPVIGGSPCMFSRTQARAIMGGIIIAFGMGSGLWATGLLFVAAGLHTKVGGKIGEAAGSAAEVTGGAVALIPGAEGVGAGIAATGAGVKKASKNISASRAAAAAGRSARRRAEAVRTREQEQLKGATDITGSSGSESPGWQTRHRTASGAARTETARERAARTATPPRARNSEEVPF